MMKDKGKTHFPYTELVKNLSGYGMSYETEDDATKALVNDPSKVVAFTMVDFVNRLREAFKPPWKDSYPKFEPEDGHGKYPDAKVGDLLWNGRDGELSSCIVVNNSREDGHCVVCPTYNRKYEATTYLAWSGLHATAREAIIAEYASEYD